jgi:hypothetical protein
MDSSATAPATSAAAPGPIPAQRPAAAVPGWNEAAVASVWQRTGAAGSVDACGPQAGFAPLDAAGVAAGFVAPLTDLGLLAVAGDEGPKFLHGQLTNDVEHLAPGVAQWYGYCTAKGRLLSTSLGWRETDAVLLTVARPQAEGLRKRLSMFVLRAKAKVADRSDATVLLGIGGAAAAAALAAAGLPAPLPMATASADRAVVVGLPPVRVGETDCPRWLLAVPDERLQALWSGLAGSLAPAASQVWRWTEVLAGIPRIAAGASEQFVPQMVNFEVVGGVSFRKGCYPGQEVVARSQYLGKLKRRMFAAHLDGAEPAPGSDVVPAAGGQPSGQVVLAAPNPGGGVDLLFESQIAAVEAGPLTAGGAALQLRPLPYALPA